MRIAGCSDDTSDKPQKGKASPPGRMQQILGTLPSPVRGGTGRGLLGTSQTNAAPYSPPAHSPVKMASPTAPPPPSWSSAPPPAHQAVVYQAPAHQAPAPAFGNLAAQWQAPCIPAPSLPELSYREKLRAGGRGAFQRANHAGFGKSATEEWTPTAAQGQGIPAQWPQDQYNISMQYAGDGDSNQMWTSSGQMQSNACWGMPMDPPQMTPPQMAPQYPYAPQLQQTMLPQDLTQMSPMAGQQPPQAFLQQMPLMLPEMAMQTPQVQQLQTAPSPTPSSTNGTGTFPNAFSMQQVQLPQMQNCGDSAASLQGQMTPQSQIGVMVPQMPLMQVQSPQMENCGDSALMALQLKAAAELQECYED